MQTILTLRSARLAAGLFANLFLSSALMAQGTAQPAPAASPTVPPVAAPSAALPDAKDILEKSIVAIGGKDNWTKLKSVEIKGSMDIPGAGIKGPMIARSIAPNMMLTEMELPGFGTVRTGFDGTTAWSIDPSGGPRLLEGTEKDMLARESSFFKDLELIKYWDTIETVGEGDFGGVACWKLSAKKGEQSAVLWFERDSGLARGSEMTVATQLGNIPVVNTIVEYRTFGDVKLGTRTETSQMGQKMISIIDSVTFDGVDPKALELPIEIKALLEPEPSEEDEVEAAPASTPAAPASTPAAPASTPAAPAPTPAAPASTPKS